MRSIETSIVPRKRIVGPCAMESRDQILASAEHAKQRGIEIMRMPIVKPRTSHGWDGIGESEGIPLMTEVAQMGIIPATEVLDREQAERVMNSVLGKTNSDVVLWLGSRNQNHKMQREIGALIAGEKRVKVGIKNQPWPDEKHVMGISSHLIDGGKASSDQLFHIHRGFMVGPNARGLRNVPDFEMALRVAQVTGIEAFVDPSHIGGAVDKVEEITREALAFAQNGVIFTGVMLEVHPNPEEAQTDAKQQLTWERFDKLLIPRGATLFDNNPVR